MLNISVFRWKYVILYIFFEKRWKFSKSGGVAPPFCRLSKNKQ
jgi:hypothetical protein